MGKNKLSSGLINVVTYDTESNISLNSGSNLLMSLSGSGKVTIPGNLVVLGGISGSSAESSSYALNADKIDNLDSTQLVLTSSFNSYTSSASSSLGSLSGSVATTTLNLSSSVSSSIGSLSGSIATTTSELSSSIGSLSSSVATTTSGLSSSVATTTSNLSSSVATTTSGLAGRIGTIEGNYATTGSNTFVGSQVITGSLYITTDLIVQGSSSLQNITASAVSIGTNTVMLNTATPAVRFAGISVQDSGSNAGVTGSIFWDGLCNKWVYSNPSGIEYSGGMLLSGPRTSTLGSEAPLTCNYIAKSGGGDHLYDSCIYEMSGSVGINTSSPGGPFDVKTSACSNILFTGDYADVSTINSYSTTNGFQTLKYAAGIHTFYVGAMGSGTRSEAIRITSCGTMVVGYNKAGTADNISRTLTLGGRPDISHLVSLGFDSGCAYRADLDFDGTNGKFEFYNYNTCWSTSRLSIDINGNIGIGTSSPNVKLDVRGINTTTGGFISAANSNASQFVTLYGGQSSDLYSALWWNSGQTAFKFGTATGQNGSSECIKMVITSTGYVGINTVTPHTALTISGPVGTVYGINLGTQSPNWPCVSRYIGIGNSNGAIATNTGFSGIEFGGPDSADEGFLAFHTHDNGVFSGERLRITKGGNVGIGTNSPADLGATNTTLTINGYGGNAGILNLQYNGTNGMFVYSDVSGTTQYEARNLYMRFGTNNAERIRITCGGNVGIGTCNPSALLHVNGTSRFINCGYGSHVFGNPNVSDDGTVIIGSVVGGTPLSLTDGFNAHTYFRFCSGQSVIESDGTMKFITAGAINSLILAGTTGIACFSTTNAMIPPVGTTAQRPSACTGMMRYNSTFNLMEFYNGTSWVQMGSGDLATAQCINNTTMCHSVYQAAGTSGLIGQGSGCISLYGAAAPSMATSNTSYQFGTHGGHCGISEYPLYWAVHLGGARGVNQLKTYIHSNSWGYFELQGSNNSGNASGFNQSGNWTTLSFLCSNNSNCQNMGGNASGCADGTVFNFYYTNNVTFSAYRIKVLDSSKQMCPLGNFYGGSAGYVWQLNRV